jgi:ABC-type transporter MlaC component
VLKTLKDTLNNSFLWLLFLVACIAYLFRKEKHLEDQLREQKFDDALKDIKDEQDKIDSDAASANAAFDELYRDYKLRQRSGGVQQSGGNSEEADRDSGSKDQD